MVTKLVPRRAVSPIDVIEAAYDLDLDARRWLARVATTIRPLLEGGHGLLAYYYDVDVSPIRWLDNVVLVGADRDEVRHLKAIATAEPELAGALHTYSQPLAAVMAAGHEVGLGDLANHDVYASFLRKIGARDYLGFRTIEPGGRGLSIIASQQRVYTTERRSQRLWARVAAHVAAARRLRENIASPASAAVEAVLTPSGKLEHAEGVATRKSTREHLREAVLRQERARGRMREKDPVKATEMWTALVSGRWSLVDRFEQSGRRYVVARCNEPSVEDPRALSDRERIVVHCALLGKPVKLIAYELGLAESTVTTHLSNAMRKLGASSRVDLVRFASMLRGR